MKRLSAQSIHGISGLQQLFIKRNADNFIQSTMVKVVNGMLVFGLRIVLDHFHGQIAKRFQIRRYNVDQQLIFNEIRINRKQCDSVHYDIEKYMPSIVPINLRQERRKEK